MKDAYTGELKVHVEGLKLKIQTTQHELDAGDGSKLQDSLDDLVQGITDYMQASGGIRKLIVSQLSFSLINNTQPRILIRAVAYRSH